MTDGERRSSMLEPDSVGCGGEGGKDGYSWVKQLSSAVRVSDAFPEEMMQFTEVQGAVSTGMRACPRMALQRVDLPTFISPRMEMSTWPRERELASWAQFCAMVSKAKSSFCSGAGGALAKRE